MLSSIDINSLLEELKADEEIKITNYVWSGDQELNEALQGKVITNVWVDRSESPKFMTFEVEGGDLFSFYAEGDCCSDSWFADFFNVSKLIGQKIIGIGSIDLKEYEYNIEDGRGLQDVDQVYGFRFYTDDVVAVLAFRNSSNGYYGGWLTSYNKHSQEVCISDKEHWVSDF